MPTLLEYQRAFKAWLLTGGPDAHDGVERWCVGPTTENAARLAIYLNTALGTLVNALALNYPALRRVVGSEFFETLARYYLCAEPPASACLNDYGAGLAGFLVHFEPAAHLSYLPDLARLEWAVSRALHADDAAPLDLARLTQLAQAAADPFRAAQLRFVPHPSVSLIGLGHPADAIWHAVILQDEAAMAAIDLTDGPVWLLIERDLARQVRIRRLERQTWQLTERLCAGTPLGAAIEAGSGKHANADDAVSAEFVLGQLLTSGSIIDFRIDTAFSAETLGKESTE